MKAISADLLVNAGTVYDKTKTTKFGNVITQTVNGNQVISPPLIKFIDTLSDFGVVPLHSFATSNGRLFVVTTSTTAEIATVVLYNFNYATGDFSAVGGLKISLTTPTKNTIRQIKVFDADPSAMKILITTINSTPTNGGLFMANAIDVNDFTSVSFATIPLATTGDTQASKKVFFLQETGGTNLLTVAQGHAISTIGNEVYVGNNTVATFQLYKFDPFAPITVVTTAGITTNCFMLKTNNVGTPAGLLGVILLINSLDIGTPLSGPNAGSECLYVPGTTGFNEFKLSDVTSGATSLPSLRTCNTLDSIGVTSAIVPASANWSDTLQRLVFQVTGRSIVKPFANNTYELNVGYNSAQFRTGIPNLINEFSNLVVSSGDMRQGWIFYSCGVASQQGIICMDQRSDQVYDYSYFTTKVMKTINSQWVSLRVNNRLRDSSNPMKMYYRAAATGSDPIFDSSAGGWIALPNDYDMSGIASNNFVQFKGAYYSNLNPTAIFAQPSEIRLIYQPVSEISDNWEGSVDNSTQGGGSPLYVAFRQTETYGTLPSKLVVRGMDDAGNVVRIFDTSTGIAAFTQSNDNGTSWSALGAIGSLLNTPFTSEIRIIDSAPVGVRLTWSIRES